VGNKPYNHALLTVLTVSSLKAPMGSGDDFLLVIIIQYFPHKYNSFVARAVNIGQRGNRDITVFAIESNDIVCGGVCGHIHAVGAGFS